MGSAETADHDQTLDTVLVGPIAAGRHKFVFQVSSEKAEMNDSSTICYLSGFIIDDQLAFSEQG